MSRKLRITLNFRLAQYGRYFNTLQTDIKNQFNELSTLKLSRVTASVYYMNLLEYSGQLYKQNQFEIDNEISYLLSKHKLLLFMEGTVDAPKSLCAANIIKMLTVLQLQNLYVVDLLSNLEYLAFFSDKINEPCRNLLFNRGKLIGGHDELLELFKSKQLLRALNIRKAKPNKGPFAGLLPIANY